MRPQPGIALQEALNASETGEGRETDLGAQINVLLLLLRGLARGGG